MKTATTVFLLTLFLAGAALAQHHPNGYAGVSTGGRLFLRTGTTTTTLIVGTSTGYGCVMDATNSLLLVTNLNGTVYRVDPKKAAVIGTLATGLVSPYDIAVDHNGDHFVCSSTTLWKVDAFGVISTVRTNLGSANGGMAVDIDTAELIIQTSLTPDRTALIHRDGSTAAVLGSGADARYGIAQDYRTGDIYIGSCCGDFTPSDNIYRLAKGTTAASVWLSTATPPVGVYSLKADRSSAASPRLILGGFHPAGTRGNGGFFGCDLANKKIQRLAVILSSLYETEILYRRNLAGINTGRGTWQILLTIPEDAGYGFRIAVGGSGVRSGVTLPDGRRINLSFDDLARLSVTTGLGPFLTGAAGILNANGQGVAQLNLAALGKAANGFLLHFIAVTVDPKAPLGVRTITDPFAFKIEGL